MGVKERKNHKADGGGSKDAKLRKGKRRRGDSSGGSGSDSGKDRSSKRLRKDRGKDHKVKGRGKDKHKGEKDKGKGRGKGRDKSREGSRERGSRGKAKGSKERLTDRDKIIRVERQAMASGAALPERRGSSVWATETNGLGRPGPLCLDRDLMFSDKSGDVLNLAYHALHAADTPLFHRLDPLGLCKGVGGVGGAAYGDAYTSGPGVKPLLRCVVRRRWLSHPSRPIDVGIT